MAQNKQMSSGPTALTTTLTTNILNGGTGAQATPPVGFTAKDNYIIIRRIHVTNKTASAATFSLWIGASAGNTAGTEFFNAQNVAANSSYDYPCNKRLDAADFLVGGAGTTTALTIVIEFEIGVSG